MEFAWKSASKKLLCVSPTATRLILNALPLAWEMKPPVSTVSKLLIMSFWTKNKKPYFRMPVWCWLLWWMPRMWKSNLWMLGRLKYRIRLIAICYFQDVTQNENWNACLDLNGQSLARCIYNCEDDESCEADCVGQFKVKTSDCPCEVWANMDEFSFWQFNDFSRYLHDDIKDELIYFLCGSWYWYTKILF